MPLSGALLVTWGATPSPMVIVNRFVAVPSGPEALKVNAYAPSAVGVPARFGPDRVSPGGSVRCRRVSHCAMVTRVE